MSENMFSLEDAPLFFSPTNDIKNLKSLCEIKGICDISIKTKNQIDLDSKNETISFSNEDLDELELSFIDLAFDRMKSLKTKRLKKKYYKRTVWYKITKEPFKGEK